MTTFSLEICTPAASHAPREVRALNVPATGGPLTVLPQHAPLVCGLCDGRMWIDNADGAREDWRIGRGVLRVTPAGTTLIARTAEPARSDEP